MLSSHSIAYEDMNLIPRIFLPPKITSALQTVDGAIGRSLKSSLRWPLDNHELEYLKLVNNGIISSYKLNQKFKICDGARLMDYFWDLIV